MAKWPLTALAVAIFVTTGAPPRAGLAHDSFSEANPYVEGRLSFINIDNFSVPLAEGSANFDDNNAIALGLEFGFHAIAGSNFSVGLSWDRIKSKNESNNVVQPKETGEAFTLGALKSEIDLYGINVYHYWKSNEGFNPFIGIFHGTADITAELTNRKAPLISGDEFTWGIKVGAQMPIQNSGRSYFKFQGSWHRTDDINLVSVSVALGYNF